MAALIFNKGFKNGTEAARAVFADLVYCQVTCIDNGAAGFRIVLADYKNKGRGLNGLDLSKYYIEGAPFIIRRTNLWDLYCERAGVDKKAVYLRYENGGGFYITAAHCPVGATLFNDITERALVNEGLGAANNLIKEVSALRVNEEQDPALLDSCLEALNNLAALINYYYLEEGGADNE